MSGGPSSSNFPVRGAGFGVRGTGAGVGANRPPSGQRVGGVNGQQVMLPSIHGPPSPGAAKHSRPGSRG